MKTKKVKFVQDLIDKINEINSDEYDEGEGIFYNEGFYNAKDMIIKIIKKLERLEEEV